ncbi:MAG: hypothetical protein EOL93_01735 [Epsilonproteobacteria bacterium]|nr:hypothetical protein [Campylobacterota bacterium]
MKTVNTKIVFYRFNFDDTSKSKDENLAARAEYDLMCSELKCFGYEKMKISEKKWIDYKIKDGFYRDEDISIETDHLFNNQFNADCETLKNHRVFDWFEKLIDNNKIKDGYYIVPTYELCDLLCSTFKCGYCGKQYNSAGDGFCHACLDSQYLKSKELHLLQLRNIPEVVFAKYNKYELFAEYNKRQKESAIKSEEVRRRNVADEISKKRKLENFRIIATNNLIEAGIYPHKLPVFFEDGLVIIGNKYNWTSVSFTEEDRKEVKKLLDGRLFSFEIKIL